MNKILIIITIIIIIIIIYCHGGATGHLVIVNRKILTLLKDLRLLLFLGLAWLRWGVSSSSSLPSVTLTAVVGSENDVDGELTAFTMFRGTG